MFNKLTVSLAVVVVLSGCAVNPNSPSGNDDVSNKAKGAGWGALAGVVVGLMTGDDADERRKNDPTQWCDPALDRNHVATVALVRCHDAVLFDVQQWWSSDEIGCLLLDW